MSQSIWQFLQAKETEQSNEDAMNTLQRAATTSPTSFVHGQCIHPTCTIIIIYCWSLHFKAEVVFKCMKAVSSDMMFGATVGKFINKISVFQWLLNVMALKTGSKFKTLPVMPHVNGPSVNHMTDKSQNSMFNETFPFQHSIFKTRRNNPKFDQRWLIEWEAASYLSSFANTALLMSTCHITTVLILMESKGLL